MLINRELLDSGFVRNAANSNDYTFIENTARKMGKVVGMILFPFKNPLSRNMRTARFEKPDSDSKQVISSKDPKRPPRFFYRGKYLIMYSTIKAKLQLNVDSKDIEEGVPLIL